jgi:hypothetical protein
MKTIIQSKPFTALIIRVSLILALLSISACSSTKLVSSWHDSDYDGPQFHNVLVIGMIKNDIKRRYYEDELVKIIRAYGGQALTSYTLIPNLGSIDDKEKINAIVKQLSVDSVIITSLRSIDKEEYTIPARVDYVPTMGRGYYGYYRSSYQTVYQPAYTVTDTVVRMESRVYSAKTDEMVWGGVTESLNPDSIDIIIQETAEVIRNDMHKHGLIN